MKRVVTYLLEEDGQVPVAIVDGGYYPKPVAGTAPRDVILIGFVADGAPVPGTMTELASEAEIEAHLASYTGAWTIPGGGAFDAATGAAGLWARR